MGLWDLPDLSTPGLQSITHIRIVAFDVHLEGVQLYFAVRIWPSDVNPLDILHMIMQWRVSKKFRHLCTDLQTQLMTVCIQEHCRFARVIRRHTHPCTYLLRRLKTARLMIFRVDLWSLDILEKEVRSKSLGCVVSHLNVGCAMPILERYGLLNRIQLLSPHTARNIRFYVPIEGTTTALTEYC